MPDSQILSERRIEKAFHAKSTTYNRVSVDKLAFEIVNHHSTMNLIDVQSAEEFKKYHLPLAINIPYETLDDRQLVSVLTQKHKANYFYSDRIDQAQKAYLLATFSGKAENYLLDGTIADFQRLYENPQQPSGKETKQLMTEYLFRSQAAVEMKNLVKIFGKSNEAVKPKVSKIKGGCS